MQMGLGSMLNGFKSVREKASNLTKDEMVESGKKSADEVKRLSMTAAEIAKDNLSKAAVASKNAAEIVVDTTGHYAGVAWNPVKKTLDDTGVTATAQTGYNVVAENSKKVANALNERIDANPNLKYAKDGTTAAVGVAGSALKSGFAHVGGWFGYKPAAP